MHGVEGTLRAHVLCASVDVMKFLNSFGLRSAGYACSVTWGGRGRIWRQWIDAAYRATAHDIGKICGAVRPNFDKMPLSWASCMQDLPVRRPTPNPRLWHIPCDRHR